MFANTRNCSDNKESTDSNEATCTAVSKPSCGLSLSGLSRPKDSNTHHYHTGFALSTDKPHHPHKGLIYKDLYINRWMLIHSGNRMIDMQPLNYGQKLILSEGIN